MKKGKYNIYGHFRKYLNDYSEEFTEENTKEMQGYIFSDNGVYFGITKQSSINGETIETAYCTVTELYSGFKVLEGKYKESRKDVASRAAAIFRKAGKKHLLATMEKYGIVSSVNPGIIKKCPFEEGIT